MNYLRSFAILAILITAKISHAVELSSNNVGQVLIFPFYLADNGWDTYVSVHASSRDTATGWDALSLRVVLRDGRDGDVIDTFNTYATSVSGEAVWRAALYRDASSQVRLRVAEGQCLVDSAGQAHDGAGVDVLLDASVGLIEVYSMTEPTRRDGPVEVALDCQSFADHWGPAGKWTADPSEGWGDLQASAISGEAVLINVAQGLSGVYAATALRDFDEQGSLVHTHPGSPHPNLADAQSGGIGAVADVLRTPVLSNDVTSLDEVDASTDWIISYPTSGYHAARPYTVEIEGEERNCSSFGVYGQPVQPGDPVVTMSLVDANNVFFSWSGDQIIKGVFGDPQLDPTPNMEAGVALCNAVNVLAFDHRPSLLLPQDSHFLELLNDVVSGASGHLWWEPPGGVHGAGQPVLAFRLTRFVNGTLEGGSVLANYAFMSPHRRGAGAEDY